MEGYMERLQQKSHVLVSVVSFIIALLLVTYPAEAGQCDKDSVVSAVKTATLGLGAVLKDVSNEGERVAIIKKMVYAVRFLGDGSGYFFVYNYKCVNIAHPDKTFEGRDLYDLKDTNGMYIIRELSEAAKKGGGFVSYHWKKPQEGGQSFTDSKVEKKFGYVEPIPGTDYFIGSGTYE
jgi:signal transduction histidine kinase